MQVWGCDERVIYTLIYIFISLFRYVFPQVFGIFDVFFFSCVVARKYRVLGLSGGFIAPQHLLEARQKDLGVFGSKGIYLELVTVRVATLCIRESRL